MLIPKKGPSVARMVQVLGITKAQATELKTLMNEGYIRRTLDTAEKILDGCGREFLYSVADFDGGGVEYVNMGDTYNSTLMFDYTKGKFIVGSWGELVEAQPRRFAD